MKKESTENKEQKIETKAKKKFLFKKEKRKKEYFKWNSLCSVYI